MQYKRLSRRVVIVWVSLELASAVLGWTGAAVWANDWLYEHTGPSLEERERAARQYIAQHPLSGHRTASPALVDVPR